MSIPMIHNRKYPLGKPVPYIVNPALGFGTLFAAMFAMIGIVSVVIAIVSKGGEASTSLLRISTIMQNILVFMMPAIIAAMVVTKLPATLLRLDVKPYLKPTIMACIVLMTSIPALNLIVELNQNISLPESLSGLEELMKKMEESANSTIGSMIGGTSIVDLIISILIIGILTGLSEELFFRGALQGIMFSTRMNKHIAVWLAAFIFSAMHFQFYGFIPRMLLGAYFGYLAWWTGSIWVPAIAHALNNSVAVLGSWLALRSGEVENAADAIGETMDHDIFTIILSVAVTATGIVILNRLCRKGFKFNNSNSNNSDNPVSQEQ